MKWRPFGPLFFPMLLLLAAPFAVAQSSTPREEGHLSPVARYKSEGQWALILCDASFYLATQLGLSNEPQTKDSDWRACILTQRAALKRSFERALSSVKKRDAIAALKAVQVAQLSALSGIEPGTTEIKLLYDQRQAALRGRLVEAWERFDVEQ